jgi:hypothetical protein
VKVVGDVQKTERRTAVEFSDREIQLIERALFKDSTPDSDGNDDNADLWSEFEYLRSVKLELKRIARSGS